MDIDNRYRAVFFDLDGTLLDTLDDLTDAVNRTMADFSFAQYDREQIRSFVGYGARRLLERAVPAGTDEKTREACFDVFQNYYPAQTGDKTIPYPGIPALLGTLKERGIKTAVISNKPHQATVAVCNHFFGDLLSFALGGDERVRPLKPAPDALLYAMEQLGVTREQCIYVGDADTDVHLAQNAKIPCISVTWGFRSRAEIAAAGGKVFADTVEQLEALLEQGPAAMKGLY